MRVRKSFWIGVAIVTLAGATTIYAQNEPTIANIPFENKHGFKVKVCQYNAKDGFNAIPKQCVTIAAKKTGSMKDRIFRERRYNFRIFRVQKIFDKQICSASRFLVTDEIEKFIIESKNCLRAHDKESRSGGSETTPVVEHTTGDMVMVSMRDNPNDRRSRRYFPAKVTGYSRASNGALHYSYKKLNGGSGRATAGYVKKDMVGVGTQIIAKPINGNSFEFGSVKERKGKLLEVDFIDGSSGYADLKDIKVDRADYPNSPQPKENQPAWVVRMCNNTVGAVKGALALKPRNRFELSYGWFNAKANECVDMPIGGAFKLPVGWYKITDYVNVYAERRDAGGVLRPVIEPANAKSYCVRLQDTWSVTKQSSFSVVWAYCDKNGDRLVPFSTLQLPEGGGIIEWKL